VHKSANHNSIVTAPATTTTSLFGDGWHSSGAFPGAKCALFNGRPIIEYAESGIFPPEQQQQSAE
jgi:hypothetical protein